MNGLIFKTYLADMMEILGINERRLRDLNKSYKNDYIRIINYHHVPAACRNIFEEQVKWYYSEFENVTRDKLESFLESGYIFRDKPGLAITFDDGFADNYEMSFPILNKYGFTGWYFVSSSLVDTRGYMTAAQLKTMAEGGHIIGNHTYSHHRMEITDSQELLKREIQTSKEQLEKMLGRKVEAFAWCGGEECHYTKAASDWIKRSGYRYSMMTNSQPVLHDTSRQQLQRTNIDAGWKMSLVRFQLSGAIDKRFEKKRIRVNERIQ
ncbi:polysaccharide deacetylase family protein [Parasporobacterium paucivorans]|uniref:Polysaccharide deacetylase n=1 Tax=Parasporobacterium paucivorans DSM 15970 TaxID=1122934 RepID=A0A1M6GVD6_9FIRM|nr:polysaccharide deacetylase family protein [Parasporobacterium paucivorans]SHJ13922.1 Polysaccharide deacetylase [Parasporobacterium paucivorans DSM 15970]